jgi:chorismate synthase
MITAGESHGKAVFVTIEGFPAGVAIDMERINHELARRQHGYGRGKRMAIEYDTVTIMAGVRYGLTLGSPIAIMIENRDHKNWRDAMSILTAPAIPPMTAPRPGHADLPGVLKYGFKDIRNVLERASARETAARVAAGGIFKILLELFNIRITSQTIAIGTVMISNPARSFEEYDNSPLRCADPETEQAMIDLIDEAQTRGDSLGGECEVVARGIMPGLGSYAHFDRRLDACIGSAMLSIPSVKGVEIGAAFENARQTGSRVQDEIHYDDKRKFHRATNRAGGIEGGMSNGEEIIVRCAIKPLPTLGQPLRTVDLCTKEECSAQKERTDTCVVPAVGVIAENMLAYVLCRAFTEKFAGDCIDDIRQAVQAYQERINDA